MPIIARRVEQSVSRGSSKSKEMISVAGHTARKKPSVYVIVSLHRNLFTW